MIPEAFIIGWQKEAPWQSNDQIEQDLILSRILVEVYNHPFLSEELLFRGGTAISKMYVKKPLRYSEDLDFVQVKAGGIKDIVEAIQQTLAPWLGKSSTEPRRNGFRIFYRFKPESNLTITRKIKIEINTREHFTHFSQLKLYYEVNSAWYSDSCEVVTYDLDELAGTKLRALYQRRKGRDLFDLDMLIREKRSSPKCSVISS